MMSLLKPRKRSNRKFILKAIFHNCDAYCLIDESLKLDRDFAIEAIKIRANVFKYLNNEFRNDREIVKITVRKHNNMLNYVGDDLRCDEEFMLELIKLNHDAYYNIPIKFKMDRTFMLKALDVNPKIALNFCGFYCQDKEVVLKFITSKYSSDTIPKELRSDWTFMLEMIKLKRKFLNQIDESLYTSSLFYRWTLYHIEYYHEHTGTNTYKYYEFLKDKVVAKKYFNVLKYGNQINFRLIHPDIRIITG